MKIQDLAVNQALDQQAKAIVGGCRYHAQPFSKNGKSGDSGRPPWLKNKRGVMTHPYFLR